MNDMQGGSGEGGKTYSPGRLDKRYFISCGYGKYDYLLQRYDKKNEAPSEHPPT